MTNSIKELIIDEMKDRYEWCTRGRDAPKDLSMQEVAEQMGRKNFLDALMAGDSIRVCRNCGRPFAAHSRIECYCNREVRPGRTCKDVGAAATRKSDPVNDALDRARRLHLYRKAAAGNTKMACKAYKEWETFAIACANRCRSGEIDIEEMKALIGREYLKDKKRKETSK